MPRIQTLHRRALLGRPGRNPAHGFTVLELLIVVLILAVLLSIILPTLGRARDAARRTSTQGLMNQLNSASLTFINDNRRAPGFFTPEEMGSPDNVDRGFSAMNNILLDLAGGVITEPGFGGGSNNDDVIRGVGPLNDGDRQIDIDLSAINAPGEPGASSPGGYFIIDQRFFRVAGSEEAKDASVRAHWQDLPDVVDAFGYPMLAWVQTTQANTEQFAAADSSTRAQFYWASNAAFLNAESLGRGATNQRRVDFDQPHSLLGGGIADDDLSATLAALTGNPAYYRHVSDGQNLPGTLGDPEDVVPVAPRGEVIFHAAGPDGYYLGSNDTGGKYSVAQDSGTLYYSRNFYQFNNAGDRRVDDDEDNPSGITRSLLKDFDDIVISAGSAAQ